MDPLSIRNAHSKAKTALNAVLQLGRTLGQLEQLSRLTVVAEDGPQAQLACTFEAVTSTYDILAIQPQSEKTLALACTSLPVDIISLDLTKRLAYRFKPSTIAAAMARGVYFEVSPIDAASRDFRWASQSAHCLPDSHLCVFKGMLLGALAGFNHSKAIHL